MVLLFCSCSEEELVVSTADGGLACKARVELFFSSFFRFFAFLLPDLNSESLNLQTWNCTNGDDDCCCIETLKTTKRETERTNQIDYCEEVQIFLQKAAELIQFAVLEMKKKKKNKKKQIWTSVSEKLRRFCSGRTRILGDFSESAPAFFAARLRCRRRLLLAAFLGRARRHSQRRCAVRSLDDRSYTSNENAVSRRPSALRSVNRIPVLDWNTGCTRISTRVSIWAWGYPTSGGMVCSSYYGWDHIAMLCENWILWLITRLDLNRNNILGTLIYFHIQLFMNINVMVWISTWFWCKVWIVNL